LEKAAQVTPGDSSGPGGEPPQTKKGPRAPREKHYGGAKRNTTALPLQEVTFPVEKGKGGPPSLVLEP